MTHLDREDTLVAAAASGDPAAFAQLYTHYRDSVYGFVYRMLNQPSISEDITHEVFLTWIRRPQSYDPSKAGLLTFFCTIARRRIIDQLRRNGNSVEKELSDEDVASSFIQSHEANPFEKLIQAEVAGLVEKAVASLPASQREVVLLREYEGLSYTEIAGVIGSSVEVVKARLYRARRLLAAQLQPLLRSNGV